MKRRVILFVIACVNMSFAAAAFGNDGSYEKLETSQTGAAMPVNDDAIYMVDEDINIVVDRIRFVYPWLGEGMYGAYIRSSRVVTTCSFTFSNESAAPRTVLMGYPITPPVRVINLPNGKGMIKHAIKTPEVYFFQVRVRGRDTAYEYASHEGNPALPSVGPYQGVYLFTVDFKPNETLVIENTVIQEYEWVHNDTPNFSYILTTGSTWKKPIGRTRISVRFPHVAGEILSFNSASYTPSHSDGSTFSYELANFTPSRDLSFQYGLKVRHIADLGAALKRCHASKDFEAVSLIHDVMSSGIEFNLKAAGLDADFLRRLYFDCGNYYYFQNRFDEAARMFYLSLNWSLPFREHMKQYHGVDASRYCDYLSQAGNYKVTGELIAVRAGKPARDAGQPGAAYYAAYNAACCQAQDGSTDLNMLELALALGYPKKEYDWILKDPDLEPLRGKRLKDIKALLATYRLKK